MQHICTNMKYIVFIYTCDIYKVFFDLENHLTQKKKEKKREFINIFKNFVLKLI